MDEKLINRSRELCIPLVCDHKISTRPKQFVIAFWRPSMDESSQLRLSLTYFLIATNLLGPSLNRPLLFPHNSILSQILNGLRVIFYPVTLICKGSKKRSKIISFVIIEIKNCQFSLIDRWRVMRLLIFITAYIISIHSVLMHLSSFAWFSPGWKLRWFSGFRVNCSN